jgi:signal transduction histidine kinase
MKRWIYYVVGIIFIFSCQDHKKDKLKVNPDLSDSMLIRLSKFDNNTNEENLNKPFQFMQIIESDSLQIKYLKTSYCIALDSKSDLFIDINKLGRLKAEKFDDTIYSAKFYWNLGDIYLNQNETYFTYYAYNEAQSFYNQKNNLGDYAQILYDLALIQRKAKDSTGFGINLIKVAEISEKIGNFDPLFKAYSLLGVRNYNLRNFQVALEYLNNTLRAQVKDSDPCMAAASNNLGNVYEKQGQFEFAIRNYLKILSTKNLCEKHPYLYAMALDNLAYNRLESGETKNVFSDVVNTLEERQNIKHPAGISISQIHISEYYRFTDNTTKAAEFAEEANPTVQSNNYNRDILVSFQLLADLQPNTSYSYINLGDSLQIEERKLKNKFERIRFETKEVKQRAEMLEEERTIILLITSLIIILGSSISIFYAQRTKNKVLELERDQKVADEKICELLFIQSARKDEGKREERDRIARELHDNILTELYANRMNLMFYKYKTEMKGDKKFSQLIDNLMDVERQIRSLSHELSNTYFDEHKEFGHLIQDFIQKIQLERSHQLTIDDSVNWFLITSVVKMNTYRILQEATMNIQKHAEASFVFIKFSLNESTKEIELIIKDDGKGLNKQKRFGIGLKNIKSRVNEINGKISIDSNLGNGTKISIFIPLK